MKCPAFNLGLHCFAKVHCTHLGVNSIERVKSVGQIKFASKILFKSIIIIVTTLHSEIEVLATLTVTELSPILSQCSHPKICTTQTEHA